MPVAPRWLLLALALSPTIARAEAAPFVLDTLRAPGRVVDVTPARFGERPTGPALGLVVACVSGTPPEEVRRLAFFPADARGRHSAQPAAVVDLPPDVVAYDVAQFGAGSGDRVALLSAGALEWLTPPGATARERIVLDPPAPLPPRTRDVSRMRFIDAWAGDGPVALIPTLTGARLVALDGTRDRAVALPLLAEYTVEGPGPPAQDELLKSFVEWPTLARGDDDGDGRSDLFALSRFAVWIYRSGPDGLPPAPSRRLALRAFAPAEELRHRATSLLLVARDLDGDGATDLIVHTTSGTLLRSHSLTTVHRNPGDGVRLDRPPLLRLEETDALASVDARDLDGDGRAEIVESSLAFGIMQVARALAMRRAEVDLRVFPLDAGGAVRPAPSWSGSVSLPLDFGQGRVEGLLPTAAGDWNGDGRRDLLYGLARDEIGIHLGVAGERGPGFGPRVATQRAPAEGTAVVADLDGDRLDDLVVFDPRDLDGAVHLFRNAGALPGTAPSLRLPSASATAEPRPPPVGAPGPGPANP